MRHESLYGAIIVMVLIIVVIILGYVWIKKDDDTDK